MIKGAHVSIRCASVPLAKPNILTRELLRMISTPSTLLFSVVLTLTCCSGCSVLIRGSGTTLDNLDSRVAVEKQFGPSENIGQIDLVDPSTQEVHHFEVENYHVHQKFNTNTGTGFYPFMALAYEPILIYQALYDSAKEVLYDSAKEVMTGHDLAFIYDEDGNTIGHQYPRPFLRALKDLSSRKNNVLKWEKLAQEKSEGDRAKKECCRSNQRSTLIG